MGFFHTKVVFIHFSLRNQFSYIKFTFQKSKNSKTTFYFKNIIDIIYAYSVQNIFLFSIFIKIKFQNIFDEKRCKLYLKNSI